jgi:hypothetical protein
MPPTSTPPGTAQHPQRRWSVVGALVAGLLAILWWWWPSINPPSADRVDVVVVTDDAVAGYARPVSDRIHESGRSSSWMESAALCASWPEPVEDVSEEATIVVATDGDEVCVASIVAWGAARSGEEVVVPVAVNSSPSAGTVTVVAAFALLGEAGTEKMPCLWWEERRGFEEPVCDAGMITVRNADGSLSAFGADRVGRMIVAALP